MDEFYESDSTRELRQIFSGQSQMFEQVRVLSQKLDEVIGRQERALSMLSSIQSGSAAQPAQIVQSESSTKLIFSSHRTILISWFHFFSENESELRIGC